MREKRILVFVLVFMLAMSSFAFAVQPALKTTDEAGDTVQKNHFDKKSDVYLHGSKLEGEEYTVEVTDPSGKVLLGDGEGEIDNEGLIDPDQTQLCDIVEPKPENEGEGCFNNTPNPGGVYKVTITYEKDNGKIMTKSKTFKVREECSCPD